MKKQNNIDKVRPSRDGHEYHEAWTARKALQLLLPKDNLIGIAVEGLQTEEQSFAAPETNEIADIVLYYGKNCTFDDSENIKIVQFKYSTKSARSDFRASNANKTITKFAAAYNDFLSQYSAKTVNEKLKFELITNRPIYKPFIQAVENIANGKNSSSDAKVNEQMQQFKKLCGLKDKKLFELARKCEFIGLTENLTETKKDISRILVDWSAGNDALAKVCLGSLKQMVRDKAGSAGIKNNVIKHVDILAALELQDVNDLLPCPESLPEVGKIVHREQLTDAIKLIENINNPLLIHAAGGMGKTVFLQSISKALSKEHEVLFFDCFGGGAYRAPDDSRHHPNRGLIHIINSLAANSLCDPILPGNHGLEALVKKFRQRLSQCVNTLSTASKNRGLIIFIDAIDNAYWQASDRNEPSFPIVLLESLNYNGNIPGVKFILSCRTHRIKEATKEIPCRYFELKPFNLSETQIYLRDRRPNVTEVEIQVAQSRSAGNPRVLEHLNSSDRGLLDKSEINNVIELNDLLKTRIDYALKAAKARGYSKEELDTFLAGLTTLPPPVPLEEYANINGIDVSAVESFAADLAPLLERTKYGLIFRDEDTETLIKENQGTDSETIKRVALNLLRQQKNSVYAARALPDLLVMIKDGKNLFDLAFDERFPASITSTVGRRNIRYLRLRAATRFAASNNDFSKLVQLLLELSTITAVDQRGIDYILDAPDLIVSANDIDAMRRLFETRTSWPGTRHARLTIINTLLNDFEAANRHSISTEEWIKHYIGKKQESNYNEPRPDHLDITAIPFCLVSQNYPTKALSFMRLWKDWYAYEVSEFLFSMLSQLKLIKSESKESNKYFDNFLQNSDKEIGVIAGALSHLELSKTEHLQLVNKLSKACKVKKLEFNEDIPGEDRNGLRAGLMKSSVIAISLNLRKEAKNIFLKLPLLRPNIWSFSERYSIKNVARFLEHLAIVSACNKNLISEKDVLPLELYNVCRDTKKIKSTIEFQNKLKKRLESKISSNNHSLNDQKREWSYNQKRRAEEFIDYKLEALLKLTRSLSILIGASSLKVDKAFLDLLKVWEDTSNKNYTYLGQEFNLLIKSLGCELVVFAIWSRADLKTESLNQFLQISDKIKIINLPILMKLIPVLAKREHLHQLAGEQSVIAKSFIEKENDVVLRTSNYIKLSRAILPASRPEAAAYFKVGLEQMDAIGSGDFEFTNELLLFSASLLGKELDEQEIHTLSNICELNMTYEEEKFPWAAFAEGLSNVSGCKMLAKLSRWDDRSKITLNYTLLPYLTALIQQNKIQPEYALALNMLADPIELYNCNTASLANEIAIKNYPNQKELIRVLIQQYENNNPRVQRPETLTKLYEISQNVLGSNSKLTSYLKASSIHYSTIRNELNEQSNYNGKYDKNIFSQKTGNERKNTNRIKQLINSVSPIDEVAFGKAIEELNQMHSVSMHKKDFFEKIHLKVSYSDRAKYIMIVAQLENLDLSIKIEELKKCKIEWSNSSIGLSSTFTEGCNLLLLNNASDFISFNQVQNHTLNEVAKIAGVPLSNLAARLIEKLVSNEFNVSASVLLGIASLISNKCSKNEGQLALTRLLKSETAILSASVVDGEWKKDLYPTNNQREIAAGFVWRMLGSHRAEDRWRSAHSIRCFAKFGKFEVIDTLIERFASKSANSFQAPELPFYYLHAQLWFLIALARVSKDNPTGVSKYSKFLLNIIYENEYPHSLINYFASRTLINCVDLGHLKLAKKHLIKIKQINASPYPRLNKKLKEGIFDEFYNNRHRNSPETKFTFHLDYDFEKYTLKNLSDVFGQPLWKVKNILSEIINKLDPTCKSMYDDGGRDVNQSSRFSDINSENHSYGQYLGFHGLLMTSERLLRNYPVTDDSYYDDPWEEWFGRLLLTSDGDFWLSDGIDKIPLELNINLLEKGKEKLALTGDKNKIFKLIMSNDDLERAINIKGNWKSPDEIKVNIDSILIKDNLAVKFAKKLIKTEPFSVWIPNDDIFATEDSNLKKNNYLHWLITKSVESKLDDLDPLGDLSALQRPKFSDEICEIFSLKSDEPFRRIWRNSDGETLATSIAWGGKSKYKNEILSGYCLLCSTKLLKTILTRLNVSLIILINLERYESGMGGSSGKFSNSVAVIRITKNLDIKYFTGYINKYHQTIA